MNKNIDVDALDGILVDHAWLFEPYMMNREAQFLEKKLGLLDRVGHAQVRIRRRKVTYVGKADIFGMFLV